MTKVQQLQQFVEHLTREEYSQFENWFEEFHAQRWDMQLADDIRAGKLDREANEAIEQFKKGTCSDL
jgi:hypothetical protein